MSFGKVGQVEKLMEHLEFDLGRIFNILAVSNLQHLCGPCLIVSHTLPR